jgi:hypothetical protein
MQYTTTKFALYCVSYEKPVLHGCSCKSHSLPRELVVTMAEAVTRY